MSFSIGIVGLPNVGKSTLFQALTKQEVEIADYPFATIDPNVGIVPVPDERLDKLTKLFLSPEKIPSVVEFWDIAGLVKNAHQGEGLGNQFLENIRQVDAILYLLWFASPAQAAEDLADLRTELELKDAETEDKSNLLSEKPAFVVVNVGSPTSCKIAGSRTSYMGLPVVALNALEELEAAYLSEGERKELGIKSKLPELIRAGYEILDLITFFTNNQKETRAWSIRRGVTAPEAAGVVHSDFEEKFIKAEVVQWDKLLESGGWAQARSVGAVRTEGKDYIMCDGDVMLVKHGA